MTIRANWIWAAPAAPHPYNETIVARRAFTLPRQPARAELAITADSAYRVSINGRWVGDGPGRAWPGHYTYDVLDVSGYLHAGANEIRVIARFFGLATFHQLPRQPGLLAQLEWTAANGKPRRLVSDATWQVAPACAWKIDTPRICVQMEPFEHYDARREDELVFAPAVVLGSAATGLRARSRQPLPWGDLTPRETALLTRQPQSPVRSAGACVVAPRQRQWVIPASRLLHPGLVEANYHTSAAHALATCIESPHGGWLPVGSPHYEVRLNGRPATRRGFRLRPGMNLLLAVTTQNFALDDKEKQLRLPRDLDGRLLNPLDPAAGNPFCFVPFTECAFVGDDIVWIGRPSQPDREAAQQAFEARKRQLLEEIRTPAEFAARLRDAVQPLPAEVLLLEDPHQEFVDRQPVGGAEPLLDAPQALLHDNAAWTTIHPAAAGDVELAYDFGTQRCGYFSFELWAEAGTVVDLFGVEYIAADGMIQHTQGSRNGLRYVCRAGLNRFISLKRRACRYLFLTLRQQQAPVRVRKLELIESTYPAEEVGAFACSDPGLDRIWEISRHTLRLCMEDTFTDCPLYEQTLWVGDARNEALYAYAAFGAHDLARHCIRLAGESLERYPLVGCQVPSGWDCLIPAWSFLWGLSVWDYYFETGDTRFLQQAWPWVERNLRGAAALCDARGLFSAPYWNLFDWSGIDDQHETVLHNSLLLVGAIDAAIQCAQVLGKRAQMNELRRWRLRLVAAVNRLWDDKRQAYCDAVRDDGSLSPVSSQHTSFLALLYDVVPAARRQAALTNVLAPAPGLVPVGSPFAIHYAYEALDKTGHWGELLASIREKYTPMLELGSTTVWETFAGRQGLPPGVPTRSHCHAWSAGPVYFLNRVVLGIRAVAVGATAFEISPWVGELDWARGTTATVRGPVTVAWRKQGNLLEIEATAPAGVRLTLRRNPSHAGLRVRFRPGKLVRI